MSFTFLADYVYVANVMSRIMSKTNWKGKGEDWTGEVSPVWGRKSMRKTPF
jgi:hypothetical protein